MRKRIALIFLLSLASIVASAQAKVLKSFKSTTDTLTTLCQEHFGVHSVVALQKANTRGSELDLYFNRSFSDFPWKTDDIKWFKGKLKEFWPKDQKSLSLGNIYCQDVKINELVTPTIGNDGKIVSYSNAYTSHTTSNAFVRPRGEVKYKKGLGNRVIALWQSHGLFYDNGEGRWTFQRSPNWRTVEDLYTQSYVLPFLIPMLENAGAYVLTPRERDTQIYEIICDNDSYFKSQSSVTLSEWAYNFDDLLPTRTHGKYTEKGSWSDAGEGFADAKHIYNYGENPFTMGTARETSDGGSATWTPDIPERGEYAVYVSYKTVSSSTSSAIYTVHHAGGDSEFVVNQKIGGGTWIYLGTFEFDKGSKGYVSVSNEGSGVLTADAVKFGGGISKVSRGGVVSGMPSYIEGALYWMQWAGADKSLFEKWDGDYTKDFAGRGAWVKWMKDDLGVPFDMSLAFHTDAGTTPNDSIIGTLAIYTLLADKSREFTNGQDRMGCRLLGDYIQTQVVNDIRADYNPEWTRRGLWDRSYSESRTTDVPGIILELLSHQNFADMKYGQDPKFRFDVCRAVYKGMLKFLSSWYGTSYVVQPLPVKEFSATFAADSAHLSWQPVKDPKEPTAVPEGYIVYTRVDGGAWDAGREVGVNGYSAPIQKGHIYSYKVEAFNRGGKSFPSEVLSLAYAGANAKKVLVVNNFDRLAAPSWFDSEVYAGFDDELDSGVPYIKEINFLGKNYEYRRDKEYVTNYSPGFGASENDFAGRKYAGNTFDYPYVHGQQLLALGYSFTSQSRDAFCAAADTALYAVDIICGKQISTVTGSSEGPIRCQVFPAPLQKAIKNVTANGVNVLISGANIASDAFDEVYPFTGKNKSVHSYYQKTAQNFIKNTLGYTWITSRGSRDGLIKAGGKSYSFYNEKNEVVYCVENADGIKFASKKGKTLLKYRTSNAAAGVAADMETYRVAAFGFPLETLKDPKQLKSLMAASFDYFDAAPAKPATTTQKSTKKR